ncbi:hypothetical protein [Allofrancisella frigidaquae]|uniref:Pyruvate carboxyltransferase domain-containing protein n=1 Tax=Allofrancisella frigidaquae TaxID=1085644 RepID=A0A6M3HSI0_9GAMM|nr:hypothetical protein [Allofrancisella frigidaquae]QIV94077.1 hypothetical protein E3E15_01390 [Allofrancisella frigidaquae]
MEGIKNIKIIDVTLRDGGYRVNFNFSDNLINMVVKKLSLAGIDYIEVGYRNGSFKKINNIGKCGLGSDHYIKRVREVSQLAKLVMMYHPRNVDISELERMKDNGIDFLRCCVPIDNPGNSIEYIKESNNLGIKNCVNLTRISQHNINDILLFIEKLKKENVELVYLADSNGSLLPTQISKLVSSVIKNIDIEIGFHPHNDLNLAVANSISALDAGATYFDTSIRGMGKGPGNLQTEYWIAYLMKHGLFKYDLGPILELADYFSENVEKSNLEFSSSDIIAAALNFSADQRKALVGYDYSNFQNKYRELNLVMQRKIYEKSSCHRAYIS